MGHGVPARGSLAVSCSLLLITTTATTHDHKEVIMKTLSQIRISALSLLVVLCLTLATLPASAQVLYDNGPINGNSNGWGIGAGDTVSDSINLNSSRSNVYSFEVGLWISPGDVLSSVDWSFTSQENGGTCLPPAPPAVQA